MTGQIPKYGKNFRLEHIHSWSTVMAPRKYVLKSDAAWYIRSDKSSKEWGIYRTWPGQEGEGTLPCMVGIEGTLTRAMEILLFARFGETPGFL